MILFLVLIMSQIYSFRLMTQIKTRLTILIQVLTTGGFVLLLICVHQMMKIKLVPRSSPMSHQFLGPASTLGLVNMLGVFFIH